ncbi:MAG: prenyltransferase [Gemmatimonadales bacterium]|nr:MAG: prenyltransferase [Gemmatimonadales bacterium]
MQQCDGPTEAGVARCLQKKGRDCSGRPCHPKESAVILPDRDSVRAIAEGRPTPAPLPRIHKDGPPDGKAPAVTGSPSSLRDLLTLIRPHQWVKNGFVAIPLLLTPWAWTWGAAVFTALGIVAFSFTASAVYIMNDYLDREADRRHPKKRHRPLAAERVPIPVAFLAMGILLAMGFGLAISISGPFAGILALYFGLNIAYSVKLKHVAILDVLIIATGFVLRVEAGAMLAAVVTTSWITIMIGLLALFIALGKRHDDLVSNMSLSHRPSLAGYNQAFLSSAMTAVLGALLAAYLIYTTDAETQARMQTEQLFYTAPFVAAGVMRYLQLMFVEKRTGDPTRIALTDRFLQGTIGAWALCFGFLVYF